MRKQDGSVGLILLFIVVVAGVLVWNKRLAIEDWFLLRNYSVPSNIAALATDDTMTSHATHDFYINHPELEDKSTFAQHCPAGIEKTIVLGCYQSNQRGIFIDNITDLRLEGVEQVTAAHEMLHAAYDRLNAKDKKYVDGLLEDYYKDGLHDQRLINTIESYKKTEPNAVVNEIHSMLGTEVARLPLALETYYKQYFTNRQKVVGYAASYQSEFVSRANQVTFDDSQLSTLNSTINSDETDLKNARQVIDQERAKLNAELAANQISVYNAAVPDFNTKIDQYNIKANATKALVSQFNQLVASRNAIATEEQQLEQALNGELTPLTQQ